MIALRLLGLLPDNGSPIVLGLFFFHFIGVATSVISFTTLNSMVWDTVEEVEIKTGRRMEGTLLAARSFAAKCMSGAGAFAAGLILTYAHGQKMLSLVKLMKLYYLILDLRL